MRKILGLLVLAGLMTVPAFGGSVTVTGGYFFPRQESDVFRQNIIETTYEKDDLNGWAGSARYDWFLGEYVNLGAGMSYYYSDTTVEDRDFVHEDGFPIFRDIRM